MNIVLYSSFSSQLTFVPSPNSLETSSFALASSIFFSFSKNVWCFWYCSKSFAQKRLWVVQCSFWQALLQYNTLWHLAHRLGFLGSSPQQEHALSSWKARWPLIQPFRVLSEHDSSTGPAIFLTSCINK